MTILLRDVVDPHYKVGLECWGHTLVTIINLFVGKSHATLFLSF